MIISSSFWSAQYISGSTLLKRLVNLEILYFSDSLWILLILLLLIEHVQRPRALNLLKISFLFQYASNMIPPLCYHNWCYLRYKFVTPFVFLRLLSLYAFCSFNIWFTSFHSHVIFLLSLFCVSVSANLCSSLVCGFLLFSPYLTSWLVLTFIVT